MERIYLTVKRTDPEKERGLRYFSIVSGEGGLHYDADCLLQYVAEQILENGTKYIVFRNHIPKDEKRLREVLETLVQGHNLALRLGTQGDLKARREAWRILNRAQN